MDISEETQKIGANPLIRYGILLIGIAVLFLSEGILTWKHSSAVDAAGQVAAINHEINLLQKKVADSEDAEEKKELREDIDALKDNVLEKAEIEAASESVDAKNGIWFWSLARLIGGGVVAFSLLVIAATGGNHEKLGALVALGLIVANI